MPAFASWHEGHRAAVAILDRSPRVPAHVVVETYSVLTRLPPPHRAPADLVATFLAERIPHPPLVLPLAATGDWSSWLRLTASPAGAFTTPSSRPSPGTPELSC